MSCQIALCHVMSNCIMLCYLYHFTQCCRNVHSISQDTVGYQSFWCFPHENISQDIRNLEQMTCHIHNAAPAPVFLHILGITRKHIWRHYNAVMWCHRSGNITQFCVSNSGQCHHHMTCMDGDNVRGYSGWTGQALVSLKIAQEWHAIMVAAVDAHWVGSAVADGNTGGSKCVHPTR